MSTTYVSKLFAFMDTKDRFVFRKKQLENISRKVKLKQLPPMTKMSKMSNMEYGIFTFKI